jgi:hypothetical protein
MKFNFRKIASALASTAMISSTIGLAAAASFPAPFVDNGSANVALVYGSDLDLGAVADISSSLSAALASSDGGSSAPASSEAYALFTSSNPLVLDGALNSVRTTVSESNLPSVLGDYTFSGNVDSDLTFQVVLGSAPSIEFAKQPTSSDDPTVGLSYSTAYGSYLYNATVSFGTAVNFTHADTQSEEIELFGESFVISSATDSDTLVLLKSAQTLFLSIGSETSTPSEVVTVDGETYTVELVTANDDSATIRVTDSSGKADSKDINEAASKRVNGLEVAVNLADESTALGVAQAEVLVGSNKLTFEEGQAVQVGTDEDPIDGTRVNFAGGNLNGLTRLTVQVFANSNNNDFIMAGDAFEDPVFGGFRVVFDSLSSDDEREDIEVGTSGSDKMVIGFTNWEDDSISNFEWVNNETGSSILADSEEWKIFTSEMAQVNESAYTILGNEDEAYLVKLRTLSNSSDSTDYSKDKVIFENVFDTTQTFDTTIDSEGTGTVTVGGNDFGVIYVEDSVSGGDLSYARIDNPDSTTAGSMIIYPTIQTGMGAKLAFYEPLTIDVSDWDGAGTTLASLMIPDGDGYDTTTFAGAAGGNGVWTTTGGTLNLSTGNSTSTVSETVGQLTYSLTATGTLNQTKVYLQGVDDSADITNPALVIFEEEDESNLYHATIVRTAGAGTSTDGTGVSNIDFTWNSDVNMRGSNNNNAGEQLESDDDLYVMMDQWGTLVTTDESDSDQYTATISYPDSQVTAMIYVDAPASGSSSGSTTTLGNVKVMDSELASSGMETKNLIVVGGSCVNTAAMSLVQASGNGCGPQWTAASGAGANEWVIETFANPWSSSKVATLVAGWEQGDTTNAATYLTTQSDVSTNVGDKWQGSTGSAATLVSA